jgi:PleD family two-component response regulator
LVSLEDLIKDADIALYRAKEQGRNQVQLFSKAA